MNTTTKILQTWRTLPAKYCVLARQNGDWGEEPLRQEGGYYCLRAADFDYRFLGLKPEWTFTERVYTESKFKLIELQYGDILVEKSGGGDRTPVGRAIMFTGHTQAGFSNFLERIIVDKRTCDPEFFWYWWVANYDARNFYVFFNQTTGIQNLNSSRLLRESLISVPTIEVQQRIASFLRSMLTKLKEGQLLLEQQIEALEAYKKSLIHEAVTKGLDPDAPMKDSGIEWIGDIPESWTLFRQSTVATKIASGKTPLGGAETYVDEGAVLVRSQNVRDGNLQIGNAVLIDRKTALSLVAAQVQPQDVLLNITGASIGRVCVAPGDIADSYVNQHVCIIRPHPEKIYFRYLFYLWSSVGQGWIFHNQIGATRESMNFYEIGASKFPYPNLLEQQQIASYLDERCGALDRALELKREQLELLKKQRQSLIFEYVTGKRRVGQGQ